MLIHHRLHCAGTRISACPQFERYRSMIAWNITVWTAKRFGKFPSAIFHPLRYRRALPSFDSTHSFSLHRFNNWKSDGRVVLYITEQCKLNRKYVDWDELCCGWWLDFRASSINCFADENNKYPFLNNWQKEYNNICFLWNGHDAIDSG